MLKQINMELFKNNLRRIMGWLILLLVFPVGTGFLYCGLDQVGFWDIFIWVLIGEFGIIVMTVAIIFALELIEY